MVRAGTRLSRAAVDPVTLQTRRLILRPWRATDLDPLFVLNGDADSMRYFASVHTRAESDAWAGRMQAQVGLANIPWQASFTPAVEIGWRVAPAHRRKGIAEEAARAALDFGFDRLGLDEIVAFTVPPNEPSWRMMEKLGMRADGRFDHPRLPDGHRYKSHLLYRLSRADRQAQGSGAPAP